RNGIHIQGNSENNLIYKNNISNHKNGIFLETSCNKNLFYLNRILLNLEYAIFIDSTCFNNDFYLNNISSNINNALDDGTNNNWDNGSLGNYWGDYGGVDADDDGIGDTPYNITGTAGSQDNYPIWDDGEDLTPTINIISPTPNQLFGTISPNFMVEIDDLNLDTMWYTIDDGLTNITFTINGTIDQNNWTTHADGSVTLIFYANDTFGNINSDQVIINKDSAIPVINIISPLPAQSFNNTAPSFFVEIYDLNLDTMWYTIDEGRIP
ncbi:unnamed protein product, partial [marine sediment metagenome]